jgi:hypothetical protein
MARRWRYSLAATVTAQDWAALQEAQQKLAEMKTLFA